jgi:hypothetical protein
MNSIIYPDIIKHGSMLLALRNELKLIDEKFKNEIFVENQKSKIRNIEILTSEISRSFVVTAWVQGVIYGYATSSNFKDIAFFVKKFIYEEASTIELIQEFSFFIAEPESYIHEKKQLTEYTWNVLLQSKPTDYLSIDIYPMIQESAKYPELRRLFPFISLTRLCFSLTTGYPFYTKNIPIISPVFNSAYSEKNIYQVVKFKTHPKFKSNLCFVEEMLGQGSIQEVTKLLVENLPPNCGPAINGTADDLEF